MNSSDKSLKSGPKPVHHTQSLSGSSRLIPIVVVFGTVAGFMGLAWYAYQAGSQSVKEDDLLVIEADKTPIKEKPTDPGGMQFPNQDKTIFDTFSGTPPQHAKVERVLPTPEEPLSRNLDTSETKTWINEKLHKHDDAAQDRKAEQMIGDAEKPKSDVGGPSELAVDQVPLFSVESGQEGKAKVIHIAEDQDAKAAQAQAQVNKERADKDMAEKAAAEKIARVEKEAAEQEAAAKAKAEKDAAQKAAAEQKAKVEKEAAEKAQKAKAEKEAAEKAKAEKVEVASKSSIQGTGQYNVQLGAYRSEDEAQAAWAAMQKKHKQLGGMKPVIVKADLGAKGIYYRLRTGGFTTAGEAKAFCNTMSILGQACILPTK